MISTIKKKLNIKNVTLELIFLYIYKFFYQKIWANPSSKTVLLIVGCQRSGTSLVTRLFARDINAKVYRETSPLSSDDPRLYDGVKLRLNSLEKLRRQFARDNAALIIAKPLVESQNTVQLLAEFPNAKALWMYRHYRDVVNSNVAAFGDGVAERDLKPILDQQQDNWRAQHVSAETRAIIAEHYAPSMSPQDAAALFWLVRNRLFFEQSLELNPNVYLCRYNNFAANPNAAMRAIYKFANCQFPGDHITQEVHADSVRKGKDIQLLPEVESLCTELLGKLDQAYAESTAQRREFA